MDDNKNEQNLEDQMKTLVMENDLLKKQLNVLNDCLSIEELKNKINDLEMKMKNIELLENMIAKLRLDIQPLNYLKSLLKKKMFEKNNTDFTLKDKSLNITPELLLLEQLEEPTILNSFGETSVLYDQNNENTSIIYGTFDKISEELVSVSDENKSLNGSIHLLDQYDIVSEEDFLNLAPENDSLVKITNCDVVEDHKHEKLPTSDVTNSNCTKPIPLVVNEKNTIQMNDCNPPLEEACKANSSKTFVQSSSSLLTQKDKEVQYISNYLVTPSDITKNDNFTEEEKNWLNINTLNLNFDILRGIYSSGFIINPTESMLKFIQHCIDGKDNILVVKPNCEWQIVISIPILQRIIPALRECQVLVLVPTRDIALQLEQLMNKIGNFMDLEICIGGDNVPRKLPIVPLVVVGTPSGVSNMITCNSLNTDFISTVLMYEVDEMMPYYPVIDEIMNKLHVVDKQITILASNRIEQILDMYIDSLQDPLIFIDDSTNEEPKISQGT